MELVNVSLNGQYFIDGILDYPHDSLVLHVIEFQGAYLPGNRDSIEG